MSVESIARILIIDNDPRVGMDLRAMLEPLKYRVEVARGVGPALIDQALEIAHSFRPHVAIVDLRLLDEYRDERSGLDLLERLQPARRILYSAYLTPELAREALKRYKATDCLGKAESPQRLLDAVAEAARESCAGRRDWSVHRPDAWTSQQITHILFEGEADVPPEIVEDALSQLFPDNAQVVLETVEGGVTTPLPVSRGRTVVFKVIPDDLEPVVVKLARSELIQEEAGNYQAFVKDRLVGRFYAQLERTVQFWDLGGAVYAFLGSSLRALPSFTAFYRQEPDSQVVLRPLKHFFTEVWSRHYEQPLTDERLSLFPTYDQALRLKSRLEAFCDRSGCQGEQVAFPGLPIPLINPVPWVLQHADDSLVHPARRAITHGDLHGDNLFVDGEHAWAIDFERTGPGHILRDFVELEVDIATRLAPFPAGDFAQFYEFAAVVAEPSEPAAPPRPTDRLLANPAARKALEVIAGLRDLAYEVTHYSDAREYLWGLLLDALFVATLVSEGSPQGKRALFLAAILCERLGRWGQAWPPQDWPSLTGSVTS